MADNSTPTTSTSLPPPPVSAGAPGQQSYNNDNGTAPGQGNGNQGNPSHMPPPPLAPVIIPQNTNPIPTAITSPMSGGSGVMSPTSAGGFVRRAAPEPNKRALYVGGLDPRVTEDVLRQIFETTGHVQNVKIIPDKNVGAVSIKFLYSRNSIPLRPCSPVASLWRSTARQRSNVCLALHVIPNTSS
jgi:nucleolysin TIA-1/TIAR